MYTGKLKIDPKDERNHAHRDPEKILDAMRTVWLLCLDWFCEDGKETGGGRYASPETYLPTILDGEDLLERLLKVRWFLRSCFERLDSAIAKREKWEN